MSENMQASEEAQTQGMDDLLDAQEEDLLTKAFSYDAFAPENQQTEDDETQQASRKSGPDGERNVGEPSKEGETSGDTEDDDTGGDGTSDGQSGSTEGTTEGQTQVPAETGSDDPLAGLDLSSPIPKKADGTTPAPATQDPAVQQMQELLQKQSEQITQLTEALKAKPAETPAATETPKDDWQEVNIPPIVLQYLDSDDPNQRAQGMAALVNGTGRMVMTKVNEQMAALEERLKQAPTPQPGQVQTPVDGGQESAQAIFQDFYNTYPQFSNPELRVIVSQAANELQAHNPKMDLIANWGPMVRDQIAQMVQAKVIAQRGTQTTQTGQQQTQQATTTQSGDGTRPGASTRPGTENLSEQEKHIEDVWFTGR